MLATLLISHYDDLPEPKVLFNKLNELKQACAAEGKVKAYQLEQLTTYPESPMELPKAVFDHAYPAGGPQPVDVQIHGLSTVADKIPLIYFNSTGIIYVNKVLFMLIKYYLC